MQGVFLTKVVLGKVPGVRYITLSTSTMIKQFLLDRANRKIITLFVRDSVDVGTMGQVWSKDDYGLAHISRGNEISKYYDQLVRSGKTPLILDCGANIGLASRYFAENFPVSNVVAFEPNDANFRQALKNIEGLHIDIRNAAIGSQSGSCEVIDPGVGNAGLRVELSENGRIPIVALDDVLNSGSLSGCVPFIAKIDIEGFERELFSANTGWVDKFPLVIIELHDWLLPGQRTSANFLQVISQLDRDFVYRNENVFSIKNGQF